MDITGGYSTCYSEFINDKLSNVTSEEELARVVEEMSNMDIVGELWDRMEGHREKLAHSNPLPR